MAEKTGLSKKTKKIILGTCIGGVVVLVAGLFTYIHIADTNTLGRKISIYGVDVSRQTAEEAEQTILDAFRSRKVKFKENGDDVYDTTLSALGYDLDEAALKTELEELQTTREANRKLFARQEDYQIDYQTVRDEEQEKTALQESNFGSKDREASIDAAIQYDKDKKEFILIEDKQGNQIDEGKLLTYVDQTMEDNFRLKLLGGDIQVTLDENVYRQPSVTASDEMKTKAADLNAELDKYRSTTVTYTFGNETQVVDSETVESWLQISDDGIAVDQDAVKTYVQDLATKYNTIYVPRTFHTSYGNDVTVSDNEYGFQIDQDGELKQLLTDLSSGEAVTRDPVYSIGAMQRNGTDDLAGSYIEVSLDNQHLWLYKDGALVTETDIVSGAPKAGRETYRGAWPIAYKASPYNLSSQEYGYNVKVDYWMPFVYGQGLHDASWQSSFGGNRYKSGAGSHGCINLPKDQAALIYNTIDGGYPIIIY
ncbi:L,D-transpeptidase family protein [Blautia sp. MSJ-19]|uniref:L,D-transpeptidase family protein n=1 Tax=Blautia sp. MSJ-19 TaxID=2841517 RepID=UPI001C0F140F|nr:L,D-transpeptidase family protein [Blautia sp. MSJ-19]MBU5481425.1 L,D-transpeptidase/peptidoglycan binding protein [Blautia sp. MSJ-19]